MHAMPATNVPMRLLLVDDDAFLRDMYATKFTESGDEVAVAKDGEEALQLLEENTYDAVVTDMIMPGISGVDLVKSIVKRNPVCIVLSNQGEQPEVDAATGAGASGYIIKADLIPSEVVTKVHNLIS